MSKEQEKKAIANRWLVLAAHGGRWRQAVEGLWGHSWNPLIVEDVAADDTLCGEEFRARHPRNIPRPRISQQSASTSLAVWRALALTLEDSRFLHQVISGELWTKGASSREQSRFPGLERNMVVKSRLFSQ
jgi:hypothetical protein